MRRKWNAVAVGMVMLIAGAMTVQAEIQDPAEYMGDWYANYLYYPEYDMTVNVPGTMECSIIVTFQEDGTMIQKMVPLVEGEEEDTVTGTWELKDNQIIMDVEGEQTIMDEMDGEIICMTSDGSYMIMGREEIVEEVDLEAMWGEHEAEENLEKAKEAKENPYVYDPEKGNQQEVIAAYMESNTLSTAEYEVAIDEEEKTFTADYPGDEYSDSLHYEGTYEITEDNYLNAQWKDEYDFEVNCNGVEYVQNWDKFTIKEDLSNLEEVIAAMLGRIDYGYEYTAEDVTMTEDAENEGSGTIVGSLEDHEFSCNYEIVEGGDSLVNLSYYNEEYDYDMGYDNHSMRNWLY